ncbi:hypothetical protein RN001_005743 [Aquatica leii]|uniref:DDE Tnp4 domain-containing protein n=1 Tax=Aquatica leii TaxID=1421715 RepID=A0AAN7Q0P9_9COLE|nr:hypothetical protein RN001_005743 [Aquatica leii]
MVFPKFTEEKWREIAFDFNRKWNFPNCIGAIYGKHIAMQAPNNAGSEFFNYKDYHSIVLLGICDANYLFTMVDISASGRQSDGGIFKNALFYEQITNDCLNKPEAKYIPNTNIKTPFLLFGDEAFPLTKYMMTPYPGRKERLPGRIRIYNYRLSRCRRMIENTFGILVSR